MKGLLAIKGARFDGRNNEADLMLNGHSSGAAVSSKRSNILLENRNVSSADPYTIRQPSPPNVATLLNNAQAEQKIAQGNALMASKNIDRNSCAVSDAASVANSGNIAKATSNAQESTGTYGAGSGRPNQRNFER